MNIVSHLDCFACILVIRLNLKKKKKNTFKTDFKMVLLKSISGVKGAKEARNWSGSVYIAPTWDKSHEQDYLCFLKVIWWCVVVEVQVGVLQDVVHSAEQKHVGVHAHFQL